MDEKSDYLNRTMLFYCELMAEIKIRHNSLTSMLRFSNEPAQIVYESCYLQLRMICELIALSCLVVHGDIPATKTKKMVKTWQADQTINRLSEIHDNFYPKPVTTAEGDKTRLMDIKAPHLTKSDLAALYAKCGDRLHRGTVKAARHKISPHNVSFSQIESAETKIVNLLQHHWICLHGSHDQIGVQMGVLEQPPVWSYWKKIGPHPLE